MARNPKRDQALDMWRASKGRIALTAISEKVGVPVGTIRAWKNRDNWNATLQNSECNVADKKTQRCKKRGGQPGNKNAEGCHGEGNQNAVGNNGGAPPRNGNAIKTGEHQTIWMDYLTEDERAYYDGINTDKGIQTNVTLRNLTFRENLMMKRLFELQEGIDNIETSTVQERVSQTIPMEVYDESAGQMQIKSSTVTKMQTMQITEKKNSMLGEILRIEEALTRVQDKKAKLLQTKHKIELDAKRLDLERRRVEIMEQKYSSDDSEDNTEGAESYIKALESKAKGVWEDGI